MTPDSAAVAAIGREMIERAEAKLSDVLRNFHYEMPADGMREVLEDALDPAFIARIEALEAEARLLTSAERDIIRERSRQVTEEGWSADHDDTHVNGEIARAAAAYCESAARPKLFGRKPNAAFAVPMSWPPTWDRQKWWKPTSPRRDLIKAAALIIAEIERLDRTTQEATNADAGERQGDEG